MHLIAFISNIINSSSILAATFALGILADGNDLVLGEASFQFCLGAHLRASKCFRL